MKKITRREVLRLHRRLWNWLAEHPTAMKCEWVEWKRNGGKIPEMEASCPCCEYVQENEHGSCQSCPIDWQGINCLHRKHWDDKGFYNKWSNAKTRKTKAKYAKLIAELPARRVK